jgi:hypothetical protein
MGKEWLEGTEEGTCPDPAHRRGGWCGVEADCESSRRVAMVEKSEPRAA